MITVDEFEELTGTLAPADFVTCLAVAQETVDAYTLYGYVGRDIDSLPSVVRSRYKRALALQTLYISQQGGVAALAEGSPNSVTLGSFSYSGGNTENSQKNVGGMLSPAVRVLMPVLVAFVRGMRHETHPC